jgi:serine/threonine protein kinase
MPPNLVGTVLGDRYRLLRVLGEGGMGTVYLAQHLDLGAQVAIKMLGEEFGDHPGFRRRFHDEARATAGVPHDHIVRVGDVDTTPDGRVYYVMEYLEGEDLSETLEREGRLAWQRVRSIAVQLCGALAAAHDQKIVHRDLKPSNCFRTVSGESEDFIKILDFGIAKLIADESQRARISDSQGLEKVDSRRWRHTVTGEILGTMAYMSPEHFFGDPVDHRTDIYALGVILYELLTGRLPLAPDNVGRFAYDLKFLVPDPPSVAAPDAGIPADIDYVVMRALEKHAHDRFDSMRTMAAALAEAREDRPIAPLALPGLAEDARSSTVVFTKAEIDQVRASLGARTRGTLDRVWMGAGLGAMIVLGFMIAFLAWRTDEVQPIAPTIAVAEPAPPSEPPIPSPPIVTPEPAPPSEAPATPIVPVTAQPPEPAPPEPSADPEPPRPTPSTRKKPASKPELPHCGSIPSADWRKIIDPARSHTQRCRDEVPAKVSILVNVALVGGKAVAGPMPAQTGKLRKAAKCIAKIVARHADVPAKWSTCRASPIPHAF